MSHSSPSMDGEIILEVGSSSTKTFPAGLRVLVVDDDRTCLKIIETMLKTCKYEVVAVGQAIDALSLLRERQGGFDLVLTDVHMPYMDGFELLKLIGKEFEIPVIMMSADDKVKVVTKGLESGASFYLLKPITINDVQNLWQYVIRKKIDDMVEMEKKVSVQVASPLDKTLEEDTECASSINEDKNDYKRKTANEKDKDEEEDKNDSTTHKKARVVWNTELHNQFLDAIDQLGIDKAVPKKILEMMNVPGLTRENVASHLQKYRIFTKRIMEESQSLEPSVARSLTNGALNSIFASDHPLLMCNLQEGYPQFPKEQRTLTSFQPGFGGSIQGHNAPIRMPSIGHGHFLNQEQSASNSIAQVRHGQSLLMHNQGNSYQPLLGTASSFNQQNNVSYMALGMEPHNIRMGSSLHGDISTNLVRGGGTMQMARQQHQARSGLFDNSLLDQSFSTLSLQGQNNIQNVGNMAPYCNSTNNNHIGIQMISTGGFAGLSNQMGSIGGEPMNGINLNYDLMDQIRKGKMTLDATGKTTSLLEFNALNSSYATQGVASSSRFASANQFPTMLNNIIIERQPTQLPTSPLLPPPPPQQQQQQDGLEDGGWELDSLFDLINNTSTIENNSPPRLANEDYLSDLFFEQIVQADNQKQGFEEVVDPKLDISTYQVDDNTHSL